MTLEERTKSSIEQKRIAFAIAYLVSFLALLNCINAFTNVIGFQTALDTVLLYGMLWVSLILGAWSILRIGVLKIDILAIFVFAIISFLITIFVFPQNKPFLFTSILDYSGNPFYLVIFYSFPGYIFSRYLRNYSQLFSYLKRFSYIVVILSVWTYFFAADSDANQYMTLSYNMLLQLIFLLYNKPNRFKVIHYLIIALGIFVVAFGGARGALLGLLVSVFLLLFAKNSTLKHKALYAVLFICISACLLLFFKEIISFFANILDMMDISSRTLEILLSEEDLSAQLRIDIYKLGIDNITIFGKGLYADRVLMQGMEDSYIHNLFLEILIDYGLIVGFVFSVTILFILIVGLKRATLTQWKLIVICIPSGFISLMLTGSYLNQAPAFYVLIGMCVNVIMERKRMNEGIADKYGIC